MSILVIRVIPNLHTKSSQDVIKVDISIWKCFLQFLSVHAVFLDMIHESVRLVICPFLYRSRFKFWESFEMNECIRRLVSSLCGRFRADVLCDFDIVISVQFDSLS